ncbi:hypothetical protein [Exiguobacterium sp. s133]|uniref:hypothetical protein n=1 Tax=Exiguobacterium sp. s133 TaxID=2751213 RepID=UPI001BE5FFCD|nr:hypothetical protein [Exiguobacterium sp. s133]
MIARISFSTSKNYLHKNDFERLCNFFGETIEHEYLKKDIENKQGYSEKPWKETFNPDLSEKESDYTLVQKSDFIKLYDSGDYLADVSLLMKEFPNVQFSMKGIPKSVSNSELDVMNMMQEMAEKIEEATSRFDKQVEFNQRCEVHVPNLGLLNVNNLAYATDYCTESLQERLQEGYRILAVCPQPDQRRPDYILGRTVGDIESVVRVNHFYGDGTEKGRSV